MSSRFPISLALIAAATILAGCDGTGPSQAHLPSSEGGPGGVATSALLPGDMQAPTGPDPRALPYLDNAAAVMAGKRLYTQLNCVGCHANGGGGMGPPLMDSTWIYGGRMEQIFDTIYHGRANGMPSWGGRVPNREIWELAAYVRSMSLPGTLRAGGEIPSRNPAPVPRAAENFDGWTVPPHQGGQSAQPL
jgi:cytochrome c oxidase cbb3-type subunit 3